MFDFVRLPDPVEHQCTGDSVGRASGCDAGGREFGSGRTITQGLKITEEKVLPLQLHQQMVRLSHAGHARPQKRRGQL